VEGDANSQEQEADMTRGRRALIGFAVIAIVVTLAWYFNGRSDMTFLAGVITLALLPPRFDPLICWKEYQCGWDEEPRTPTPFPWEEER
jgi:hypothetical protein